MFTVNCHHALQQLYRIFSGVAHHELPVTCQIISSGVFIRSHPCLPVLFESIVYIAKGATGHISILESNNAYAINAVLFKMFSYKERKEDLERD